MTRVTLTSRFLASASAPATMVFTAARSRYFFVGRSVAKVAAAVKKARKAKRIRFMRGMLPSGPRVCQSKEAAGMAITRGCRRACREVVWDVRFRELVRFRDIFQGRRRLWASNFVTHEFVSYPAAVSLRLYQCKMLPVQGTLR